MAVSGVQIYHSLPLQTETSIRLLKILTGPDEQIECLLDVVDLNHDPPYDCLSYTWGDPMYHDLSAQQDRKKITNEPKCPIICNGLIIDLTENLYEALMQLRRRFYQKKGAIWIDSICIDQKNDQEKNTQVAMMHRIYSSAQTVIIWLGIADIHTEPAIEIMKRLSSVSLERITVDLPFDLDDSELYRLLGIPEIEPQQWLDFAAFLQRSWFSRMWVIQESAVAKRINVICGTYTILWPTIIASVELLHETRLVQLLVKDVIKAVDSSPKSTRYVANILANPFIFEKIRRQVDSLSLEQLLAYSRYFKVTNERGRVFAILGLWKQASEHKALTVQLQPDYRLKVEEVYSSAAWATIHEMQDLNLLTFVEDFSFRALKGLPSWVPDYSVPPLVHPLVNNMRAAPGEERWKAGNGLHFKMPIRRQLRLLTIDGIQVDVINTIAATDANITTHYQLKSFLEILFTILDTPYPSGSAPIEAFWRTLIKDTFRNQPAGPESRTIFPLLIISWVRELKNALSHYHNAIKPRHPGRNLVEPLRHHELAKLQQTYIEIRALIHILSLRQDIDGIIPTWSIIQKSIKTWKRNHKDDRVDSLETSEADRDLDAIKESFRIAYSGRRLFLGIAAISLQRGDSVWVIAGATVPVVLRRLPNGNWKLVGEAYVYGLMNGEAFGQQVGEVERIVLE